MTWRGRRRRAHASHARAAWGALALVAAVALALVGCGGATPEDPSTTWTPQTVTPPPSVAAPTTPTAPISTKTVKLASPCQAVTVAQVSKIMGKTYASADETSVSGSKVCTYAGNMESPSVTTQLAPLATSLSDLNKESTKVFTSAKTVGAQVAGADQAVITTGKVSTAPAVLVAFAHGHVYAMVLIIAPSGDYSSQALQIAELLAKAAA